MDSRILTGLEALMALTRGAPEVAIALLDGPVATNEPSLSGAQIRFLGPRTGTCASRNNPICQHATMIAELLLAADGAKGRGLCPGCTLLVRPIFDEAASGRNDTPDTSPAELGNAIVEAIEAGARVINVSSAFGRPSTREARPLEQALDRAAARGVLVVAAAGNQGVLGSSVITRHPWVIPVAACDASGRPAAYSNFGASIARHGLLAPGVLDGAAAGTPSEAASGTSLAVPYVSGAIALLVSLFPAASAAELRAAITLAPLRRRSVVPPLLDARNAMTLLERSSTKLRSFA